MDDGQIEELRKWALGLVNDDRPEVKAAAKAILLLSDDLQAARTRHVEAQPHTGRDRGSGLRARLGQPQQR
jgi:hypothetical protein